MKNVTYINAGAGSGKTTELTKILSRELCKKDETIKPSEVILLKCQEEWKVRHLKSEALLANKYKFLVG